MGKSAGANPPPKTAIIHRSHRFMGASPQSSPPVGLEYLGKTTLHRLCNSFFASRMATLPFQRSFFAFSD